MLQFVVQQLGQMACKHSDVSLETIGIFFAVGISFGSLFAVRCQLVDFACCFSGLLGSFIYSDEVHRSVRRGFSDWLDMSS